MVAVKMNKYELIEIDLTKVLNSNKESGVHGSGSTSLRASLCSESSDQPTSSGPWILDRKKNNNGQKLSLINFIKLDFWKWFDLK